MQVFQSEDEANEVLEYYENYLLRCQDILYLAVVKKPLEKPLEKRVFMIEIGVKWSALNENKFKSANISPLEVYGGNFGIHQIPIFFPVPSEAKKAIEEGKPIAQDPEIEESPSKKLYNIIGIKNNEKDIKGWIAEYLKKEQTDLNGITPEPITPNSLRIISLHEKKGTLGGVFKLEQFPESYFGITNQHLFSDPDTKFGDPVTDDQDDIIGHLFWTANDLRKEVAFIKLNDKFLDKYTKGIEAISIKEPQIGMKVYHNGFSTHGESSNPTTSTVKIHSINATIRITDPNITRGQKIYKNQVLIESNAEPGDSGSLVFNNDDDNQKSVIGLNFAETNEKHILGTYGKVCFTVANNINNIFNKDFNEKQEVFDKIYFISPGQENTKQVNTSLAVFNLQK